MDNTIYAHAVVEVMGKPKDHVEKTVDLMLNNLKERKGIELTNIERNEAEQLDDSPMYTAFFEIDAEFRNFEELYGFIIDHMPTSIEINDPEEFRLDLAALNNMIAEFLGRLHGFDKVIKEKIAENVVLHKKMDHLIRNLVLLALRSKALDTADLAKRTGIQESSLTPFLRQLLHEKIISESEGKYALVKHDGEHRK